MPKYPADKIKTLPDLVQDNFYSAEIADRYMKEIFPLLDVNEVAPVKDLVMDVYYKAVTPSAFPTALAAIVKDPAKAKDVTARILGHDFLPIADYLETDIISLIEKNGGDPLVFRSKVPVRDVVARVIGKGGIPLEERLEERLMNIMRSFVAGARKDEQIVEMLKGNVKTSGIGLNDDQAMTLLALAKTEKEMLEKRGVDVVPDQVFDAAQRTESSEDDVASAERDAGEASLPVATPEESEQIQALVAELPSEDVHTLSEMVRTQDSPAQPLGAPKKLSSDAFSAEDAEEIVILQKRLPEKVDIKIVGQTTTMEDNLAHEIVAIADVHLPNEDITKRFLYAVKLYIREIRDALETKSKFTTPITAGGIGMADAEAARVMMVLTAKLADLRAIMAGRAQKAKDEHVSAGMDRHLNGPDDAAKTEQAGRDALYKDLTGKTPHEAAAEEQGIAILNERKPTPQQVTRVIPVVGKDEPVIPDLSKLSVPVVHEVGSHVVAPALSAVVQESLVVARPKAEATPSAPVMPVVPPPPVKRTAPPPDALPVVDDDDEASLVVHEVGDTMDIGMKEKVGSVPTTAAPAPIPKPTSLASIMPPPVIASGSYPTPKQSLSQQIVQEIASGAEYSPARNDRKIVAPAPKPVAQSVAPSMTPPAAAKPTVSDVMLAPKLTSPTDALRSMSIVDFRRLSKDPKEATLKIKDKIDLLAEESFERKTEGIKAWQASESNRTYLSMLRMSLEGEPLVQVITKQQDAGQPVLTKEEFDAIMELNRDLRFG